MKRLARNIISHLPLVRTLVTRTPTYYVGGVIENRLGWQLARILLSPQSRYSNEYVVPELSETFETIRQEGIAVIPNFLPPDQFEAIQAQAADVEKSMTFQGLRQNNMIGYMEQACHTLDKKDQDSAIWKYLAINDQVNRLASFTLDRKINQPDRIDLDFYRSSAQASEESNDIDNILHADIHLDTVKIWFTLSDVTAENGPFVFAKGTHLRCWERLKHEYRKSIDNANLKAGHSERINPTRVATRGSMKRVKLSDDDRNRLKVKETPTTAPAGSLIIANTFGFHRRGEFQPNQVRRWIQLGYRSYNRGIS